MIVRRGAGRPATEGRVGQAIWRALTVVTALWLVVLTCHVTMRETDTVHVGRWDDGSIRADMCDPSLPDIGDHGATVLIRGDQTARLTLAQDPCIADLRVDRTDSNGATLLLMNGKSRIVAGFENRTPVIVGYGPDGKEAWRQPAR